MLRDCFAIARNDNVEAFMANVSNYFLILEECAINFKIPLTPPFSKGEITFCPLWKRGVRGDFIELELICLY